MCLSLDTNQQLPRMFFIGRTGTKYKHMLVTSTNINLSTCVFLPQLHHNLDTKTDLTNVKAKNKSTCCIKRVLYKPIVFLSTVDQHYTLSNFRCLCTFMKKKKFVRYNVSHEHKYVLIVVMTLTRYYP